MNTFQVGGLNVYSPSRCTRRLFGQFGQLRSTLPYACMVGLMANPHDRTSTSRFRETTQLALLVLSAVLPI